MADLATADPEAACTAAVVTGDHVNRAAHHLGDEKALIDVGDQRFKAQVAIFQIEVG